MFRSLTAHETALLEDKAKLKREKWQAKQARKAEAGPIWTRAKAAFWLRVRWAAAGIGSLLAYSNWDQIMEWMAK